jgi:hypothetical protein
MQRLPDACECVIVMVGNAFRRVSNHIFGNSSMWADMYFTGDLRI